jgi:hypothetical protein
MWRLVLLSIGLLALVGCGSKGGAKTVVTGSVTYKGKPVNGGALILYDTKSKAESGVSVPVMQDGTYNASSLAEGEYRVVVQPSESFTPHVPKGMEGKAKIEEMKTTATIAIPDKYKKLATTDLRMTVKSGEQKIDMELKD